MDLPKNYFHDRLILVLLTLLSILVVVGVSLVMLRFDPSRNPTTTAAYRPNITGTQYQSGKPIDIYSMAIFMVFTSVAALILSIRTYRIRRFLAVFILSSTVLLLILSMIVANALISLQ
ncbi:MAG TPA: hypothetical protein VFB03_00905 [Candidatus Saccharimonadales bacterium]|nr:hypothetical protein [Candidatus Saccharimonadales bacterium]